MKVADKSVLSCCFVWLPHRGLRESKYWENISNESYLNGFEAANAQAAITNRMLKTAEPTMVPIPTSLLAMKTPMIDVKSSGAEPPAAMKVAPATSGLMPS